jgi:hypothetical protein
MTDHSTAATRRPLADLAIGISISEAEAPILRGRGLTPTDVNHVTVELCRRLISLGAQVVLGHQWRPGGVMEAVATFAQVYQPESNRPIIRNFLAYPDRAALSSQERKRLSPVVAIHDDDTREPLPRQAALRRMREQMADVVDARICLCGMLTQAEGYIPGLIEEVALTLVRGRPVYISGMMGGNAELIARFIAGERDIFSSETTRFEPLTVRWRESPEFHRQLSELSEFDVPRLAERCGLDRPELIALFEAQNLDTVLHLTAKGLSRLHRN